MQDYLRQSRLGTAMDTLGFHAIAFILSNFWFILLWGVRFPSLLAGVALYGMIVILRKKVRDDHVTRKEAQLRSAIGGELALERLLLTTPEKANFEIAMLLSVRENITLIQAGEKGVLCVRKGKKWLVSFLQSPQNSGVSAADVLALQREIRLLNAERGLLCVCGKMSAEAERQAQREPRVSFLERSQLIAILGSVNPATDSQLVSLGRRRKKAAPKHWLRLILHPARAKRFACYGTLLLGMYLVTHLFYYAIPGLVCMTFATACRCVRRKETVFQDEDERAL